ncbi:hypothetical protein BCR32DRAFT_307234 [Anaeromyces robustus]|uniref:Uncharacterized protein n=1 Tax=Anaeromyces robustus TaxID=1754192 RepID=A0A1Y1VRB8_9FUNG|nr:hypothetical protein BCR32DRAFT_307234 [Anaeromyces robustus]|eukprot:ORX63852.1 hypothetical protein BCR32DRAFT_307234 [Anaeromyces robustus]
MYLSQVYEYKYLGFPHTYSGIDWKTHLNESARKSLNILDTFKYYKNIWPTYIKLHIFRIYIRPIMEYSACLAFYWMNSKTTDKLKNRNYLGSIDYSEVSNYHKVIQEGLEWIVNHNRMSSSACLLGIPTTMTRLYCLALKLQRHIAKMDVNNPLYLAFNPPGNVKPFTCFSFANKVYRWKELFTVYKYFDPTSTNESYSEQIKKVDKKVKEVKVHEMNKSIMGKLILPSARINLKKNDKIDIREKITSADKCVFIRDRKTRNNAVDWRINCFLFKYKCPICRKEFNRGHINKCDFIHQPPYNRFIKEKDIYLFNKDKEKYENLPKSYNILDSLLNHQNYYTFGKFTGEMIENSEKINENENEN